MTVINATRGASKKYVDTQLATEASDKQDKIDALNAKVGSVTVSDNTVTRNYGTVTNQVLTDSNHYTDTQIAIEENRATTAEERIEDLVTTGSTTVDNVTIYTYGPVTQQVLDDANDYTDAQISQRVTQVYSIQGTCTHAQLDQLKNLTGNNTITINGKACGHPEIGNIWNVTDAYGIIGSAGYVPPGTNYVWTGTDWDAMGGSIDLSTYELTSSVDTKLAQYSKATMTNTVLAQHQNLIFQKGVTVAANDITFANNQYSGRKTIDGLTQAYVAGDPAVIVSPDPQSIQAAVDCGLYATGLGWDSQNNKAYITFGSDTTPASNINVILTFVDLSAGVQIPMTGSNVNYS